MLTLFPQQEAEKPRDKGTPTQIVTTESSESKPSTVSSSGGAAAKRDERRQQRRAGIALQVRVRTADFTDGTFEEVRTTQNASRKAVYFLTNLDRYYKGMRVRITSPYDPNGGSGNLEQVGEVVRVHRKDQGYGVAIALSCGPRTSVTAAPATASSGPTPWFQQGSAYAPTERRSVRRSPFIAPVELVDVRMGTRVQARTSDLSLQGCYVDTLNPLPVGAMVRLQIQRHERVLDALAVVSSRHPGSGMGLVFSDLTPQQSATLAIWLGELALPPRAAFAEPTPARHVAAATRNGSEDRASRLIQMLLRKGLLTQSEANELLTELD